MNKCKNCPFIREINKMKWHCLLPTCRRELAEPKKPIKK